MIILVSIYDGRIVENIGLQRIESFLFAKGIDVEVLYISNEDFTTSSILEKLLKADCIGMSIFANTLPYAKKLSKIIKDKNPNSCIFYGSQYVTSCYKTVLNYDSYVDFLCLGQGEYPIYDFVKQYDGTNLDELVKNSKYLVSSKYYNNKINFETDISNLPWSSHRKEIIKNDLFAYLNTSQGCIGNCSFCGHIRTKWSGRSPQEIADEILNISNKYDIHAFSFSDNSIEDPGRVGKKRLYEFAKIMENIDKRFAFNAFLRADSFDKNNIDDVNLLKLLRKIGFNQFLVGVESGNDYDLKLYNKRATVQQNKATLKLLRENDIIPFYGFIMLNPYSTRKSLSENFAFLDEDKNFFPGHYFSYLMVYEITNIYYKIMKDKLLVKKDELNYEYSIVNKDINSYYTFVKSTYIHTKFSEQLSQLQNTIKMFNYIQLLTPNTEELKEAVNKHKDRLSNFNHDYFSYFFDHWDINYLYNHFQEYSKNVVQEKKCICDIYLVLLKKYYKTYNRR